MEARHITYYRESEDCMGRDASCWVCDVETPGGTVLSGEGATAREAQSKAEDHLKQFYTFEALGPRDKLAVICSKPRMSSVDMEEAIRAINVIIQGAGR